VAVGDDVGVTLVVLVLALAAWALVERKKRKRDVDEMAYGSASGGPQPPSAWLSGSRSKKAERVSFPALLSTATWLWPVTALGLWLNA
jgi:hypothetical protein